MSDAGSPRGCDGVARALSIAEELLDEPHEVVEARLAQIDESFVVREVRSILGASELELEDPGATRRPVPEEFDLSGEVLGGKFLLERRVDGGSMGVVYQATNLRTQGRVAVKLLRDASNAAERQREGMREEARLAASVDHPAIVRTIDHEEYDGAPVVVMEWVEGVPLSTLVRAVADASALGRRDATDVLRERLESDLGTRCTGGLWSRPYVDLAADVALQIARGLEAVHAQNVVHRDIAPKNILLTPDGRARIVDFGVALLSDDPSRTQKGPIGGTLEYMAPEQLRPGSKTNSASVDVYALGATLFHMLAGTSPFHGAHSRIFDQVLTAPTPDVLQARPETPADLAAVCFGAMEKVPSMRYASAGALAEDLECYLQRLPVSRRPVRWAGRAYRWSLRRPAQATAAVAAAIALAVSAVAVPLFVRVRAERAIERDWQTFAAAYGTLPAMVTLEAYPGTGGPPELASVGPHLESTFATLLDLQPDEPILRWYRANLRSQIGDVEGAARDLEALRARGSGGGILEQLGDALTSEDPAERNGLVPASELPAAETAFEHALRGYVQLRERKYDEAWSELTAAVTADPGRWTYRDLRCIAFRDDALLRWSLEDAVFVEGILGRETPRTQTAQAFVDRDSGDVRGALAHYARALELGGEQFQPHVNSAELHVGLAWDATYRGDPAALEHVEHARDHLAAAARLRPGLWITTKNAAQCDLIEGDYEAARRRLEAGIQALDGDTSVRGTNGRVALTLDLKHLLSSLAEDAERNRAPTLARTLSMEALAAIESLVGETEHDPPLHAEVRASATVQAYRMGSIDLEEAYASTGAALRDYGDATGLELSPVIAVALADVIRAGSPEREHEARALYLFGLGNDFSFQDAVEGLDALSDR
ncbi:MAG: protein kinase [Planctomycetota bacterium]